jgi:hypothetical protein
VGELDGAGPIEDGSKIQAGPIPVRRWWGYDGRQDGERAGQAIGEYDGETAAARTGTGDGGRGELAAVITSRGSVGVGTLKPALIPC